MRSQRTAKNTEFLWRALEQEQVAPRAVELPLLSGLDANERLRFTRAWPGIPAAARRQLLQTLTQLAEDDFEMDFNVIFRLALQDSDAEVRAAGVDGLWEDDDVRLLPELVQLLLADEAEKVRIAAAQCLAHFVLLGEVQKIQPQLFERVCRALLLVHLNPAETLEVRRRALESLAYASRADLPALIQAAHAQSEEAMQVSAVFAMGRSADPRWKDTAARQLHHPNPAMRYEAARACGELLARDAVPDLIELVEDVDIEVQEAALWALGQIGGDLARFTLERYLEADSEALRAAANQALQELEFLHDGLETFSGPPEDFVSESLPWDLKARQWTADDDIAEDGDDDEALFFGDEDDLEDEDEDDDNDYDDEDDDNDYDDDDDDD